MCEQDPGVSDSAQRRQPRKSPEAVNQECRMRITIASRLSLATFGAAIFLSNSSMNAQESPAGVVVGNSDLGGVVRSEKGPEAGVWVIAETVDLPTKFA